MYIGTKRLKVQDKTERWKSVENSILVGANAKHDMRVNMCNIYIYNMVSMFLQATLKTKLIKQTNKLKGETLGALLRKQHM